MAAKAKAEEVPVDGAEEQQPPAAAEELAAQKRELRLRKFRELHLKRECTARGEDYKKVKLLEISAEDAEKWERKKRRKNPNLGFSELKNETNTARDVLMMMQILTTLMKGMPNSTRQKDSMGNIQLKLNKTWKEEQLSNLLQELFCQIVPVNQDSFLL
ncbi:pre-mRNA-splicing factor SYF2-like isoform X2 [Pseudorca crassidens]|uniref:pre-mRNA-splicing factor SYF2-like isoform X2 n=1 Tax=Pseudorca crassidens TaxID=82174 RepID=UPI00352D2A19